MIEEELVATIPGTREVAVLALLIFTMALINSAE